MTKKKVDKKVEEFPGAVKGNCIECSKPIWIEKKFAGTKRKFKCYSCEHAESIASHKKKLVELEKERISNRQVQPF